VTPPQESNGAECETSYGHRDGCGPKEICHVLRGLLRSVSRFEHLLGVIERSLDVSDVGLCALDLLRSDHQVAEALSWSASALASTASMTAYSA